MGGGIPFGRLLRMGLLAVLAAVLVSLVIRAVAVAVFGLSGFFPLAVGPTVAFTVGGVFGAVVVFAFVARFARDPVRLFGRVASAVLLLSLIPDVLLLVSGSTLGTTFAGVLTLRSEHVATWAVSGGMLTTLARGRG
ncbi:MAG: DUF6069 family protein [Actinomycetota bacterium]|nr:DUF6069 family protein [Actinomycetota bacterium]